MEAGRMGDIAPLLFIVGGALSYPLNALVVSERP